ncbi:MAG TPA: hypothetical protein EYM67_02295 [Candidatus Poseidoniales archaeon]|nr:hypothetical protein [Candidatus Poseidoniales archaeon]
MRHDVLVLSLLGLALLVAAGSEAAAPEATILQIDPQEVNRDSGTPINFDGQFSDGDDDQLEFVYWNSSIDDVIHSGSEFSDLSFQRQSGEFSQGNHTITLVVKAGGEWSANATSWLNVTGPPPRNPDASVSINPPTAHQGEEVSFVGSGTYYDPATSIVVYEWYLDDEYYGGEMTFSDSGISVGDHTMELIVEDNEGLRSEPAQEPFQILPPIPLAHLDSIDPSPAKVGEVITFSGHCTGASGDVEECDEYRWDIRSDTDGSTLFSLYGAIVTVDNLTEGDYEVWLRIIDGNGTVSSWVSDSLSVGPPNKTPVATITISPDPLPSSAFVPEYYQFVEITFSSGSSSDSDGNLVGWRWWFDGALVSTSPDWVTTFDSLRDGTVKLQVMDDDGVWSGNNSRQFRIVANTAPTAAILLTPAMAVEIDALVTLNGSGTDAEGYIAGWEWSLDGVVFAITQNATVSSNITGAHAVMLTVTDDGGLQANASASFTVKELDIIAEKYFDVSVSPLNAAIGEDITIDLTGTTGPVEEFEINIDGDITTTQDRTVTISFDAKGTYNLDITVWWSDGTSFDQNRDFYTTTVTVTKSGGGSGGDAGSDDDGSIDSGGGLPGPGLLAALAGLGLAARRKR